MKRILGRGRPGEENIKIDYMTRLDLYYKQFLEKSKEKFTVMNLDNNSLNHIDFVASTINKICLERCK